MPARIDALAAGALLALLVRRPQGIAAGLDGNLWFSGGEALGRLTPSGELTELSFPGFDPQKEPTGVSSGAIAASPAGFLWVASGGALFHLTPEGQGGRLEEVANGHAGINQVTSDPSGNAWLALETDASTPEAFRRIGAIARVAPDGATQEFSLPEGVNPPHGITVGPEGNIWFSQRGEIGRMTPNGEVTEFHLPVSAPSSIRHTGGITVGADGNLWFPTWVTYVDKEGHEGRIGRITPGGEIDEFQLPNSDENIAREVALGSDGNIWFTGSHGDRILTPGEIGRITPIGQITEFPTPYAEVGPLGITAGPDGALWFTGYGSPGSDLDGGVGRIVTGVPGVQVTDVVAARHGRVKLRIACGGVPPGEECGGSLRVTAAGLVLVRRSFEIPSEQWTWISLPVRPNALATLNARGRPQARIQATVDGGQGMSRRAVLSLARLHS